MQACFIGHRTIEKSERLISAIKETVIALINKGVTTFLFGSKSDFDKLSWEIVTELKDKYPFIKRVYYISSHQYVDKFYNDFLLKSYEETYFSLRLKNAGKCSYVERNYEMIDDSTYCIFYFNKDYIPDLKHTPINNTLLSKRRNSGTKIAFEYATKKKKEIINLFK